MVLKKCFINSGFFVENCEIGLASCYLIDLPVNELSDSIEKKDSGTNQCTVCIVMCVYHILF